MTTGNNSAAIDIVKSFFICLLLILMGMRALTPLGWRTSGIALRPIVIQINNVEKGLRTPGLFGLHIDFAGHSGCFVGWMAATQLIQARQLGNEGPHRRAAGKDFDFPGGVLVSRRSDRP
jgi:hypothetical protein